MMSNKQNIAPVENLRIPPHSMEAEQSFLGSILIDGRCQRNTEAMDLVSPEMLYNHSHQEIYRAMLSLKEIDLVTVNDRLEQLEVQEADFAYLGALAKNTPTTVNVASYAKTIKDRWIKREFLAVGNELIEQSYNRVDNAEMLEFVNGALSKIDTSTGYKPKRLSERLDKFLDRMQGRAERREEIVGLKTGITGLDDAIGGIKEDWLITLAGRSGMGKTLFANLLSAGISEHYPTLFFSMEMSDDEIEDRFMSIMAGISSKSMATGLLDQYESARTGRVFEQFKQNPNQIIYDDTPALSVSQIATRARETKREVGKLSLIVIDYLGLMQLPKADRHDLQIGMVTKALKQLAKELRTPILLLAQANRGADQVKRPDNSHLYGSSAIEADSDLILFVYREETRNPSTAFAGVTEIVPTKFRHGNFNRSVFIRRNDETGKYQTLTAEQIGELANQDEAQLKESQPQKRKFSQAYAGSKS